MTHATAREPVQRVKWRHVARRMSAAVPVMGRAVRTRVVRIVCVTRIPSVVTRFGIPSVQGSQRMTARTRVHALSWLEGTAVRDRPLVMSVARRVPAKTVCVLRTPGAVMPDGIPCARVQHRELVLTPALALQPEARTARLQMTHSVRPHAPLGTFVTHLQTEQARTVV